MNPPFSFVLYEYLRENFKGELKKYGYKTHLNVKVIVKLKTKKLEMHISFLSFILSIIAHQILSSIL